MEPTSEKHNESFDGYRQRVFDIGRKGAETQNWKGSRRHIEIAGSDEAGLSLNIDGHEREQKSPRRRDKY